MNKCKYCNQLISIELDNIVIVNGEILDECWDCYNGLTAFDDWWGVYEDE